MSGDGFVCAVCGAPADVIHVASRDHVGAPAHADPIDLCLEHFDDYLRLQGIEDPAAARAQAENR